MSAAAGYTPEQLAQMPAAKPPPGVVPNFVNPHSDGPILIAVGSVLVAIMLVFTGVRFYSKAVTHRPMKADDWTTIVAVLGTLLYYAVIIHACTAAKFGTHMWDMSAAHAFSNDFLIASFFINWPTAVIWAFAKTSFFLMYIQIFHPFKWLCICSYIGMAVNWAFYIAVMIPSIYYMAPGVGQTWQEGFMNPRYTDSLNMTIPIAAGSLILDIYILLLPMMAVPKLQLSFEKKIGIATVFATGVLACVASSLSIYFKHRLNEHEDDYTYWVYPVLLMCLIEMCVGISCACMPSFAGFFRSKVSGGNQGPRSKFWSSNAFSRLRSILSSRHGNSTDRSFDKSKGSKNGYSYSASSNQHPYKDIELGRTGTSSSEEELRPTLGSREIHVRQEYYVRRN